MTTTALPSSPPMASAHAADAQEDVSCEILKHIAIAAVAAVAFALLATLGVSSIVLSGFMFSILLPVPGAVYLVAGISILSIALIGAERAISHGIDAYRLAYPSTEPEIDAQG